MSSKRSRGIVGVDVKYITLVLCLLFGNTNLNACSPNYESPWFWKKTQLVKNSDWIIVGKVKETKIENEKKYFVLEAREKIKNLANVSEFKIGPFSTNAAKDDIVGKDVDCQLIVNLDSNKEYIFFSENYNPSSIIPFSKKERSVIVKINKTNKK